MSPIVRALGLYVPAAVKRRGLERLSRITAEAFAAEAPSTRGLSYERALEEYALFTSREAAKALQHPDCLPALQARLREGAEDLGAELRRALRVRTLPQAGRAFELLYRLIGIEISAHFPGEVTVNRCMFSRYYTADVCRVISALDDGVAAGLCCGGRLVFERRITEGSPVCRAHLLLDTGVAGAT